MSVSLDSNRICLDIDSSITANSTVSFDILNPNVFYDLDSYEIESNRSLITYFINQSKWGVFEDGFLHLLPPSFISGYLMKMYKDNLPEGMKFSYGY